MYGGILMLLTTISFFASLLITSWLYSQIKSGKRNWQVGRVCI